MQIHETRQVAGQIESLLDEARKHVVLVRPYLTLGGKDFIGGAIRRALRRKVDVELFWRIDDSTHHKEHTLEDLAELSALGLKGYVVPSLHAKLYYSESTLVLTSLNLLKNSVERSIEFGVAFSDPEHISEARRFVDRSVRPSALRASTGLLEAGARVLHDRKAKHEDQLSSYCVRCAAPVEFDRSQPLCEDDYESWVRYQNGDYPEHYCHYCGQPARVTKASPCCSTCAARLGPWTPRS